MRRELTANKAQALLARIRPADDVATVRLHIARDHLADIRALDARLKYIGGQIGALVAQSGTTLTSLFGIGLVIAGRILAEVGDITRFAAKDKFASYNGTAPIDVSSGDQIRHRLSRAGNRRNCHALHMMAVTQIRYPGTDGRRYYERKRTEGKTPKEALRCLKRRLSDQVWRQLVRDQQGRIGRWGHLRSSRRCRLHLPHRPAAHPRPHQHPPTPPEGVPAFVVLDCKDDRQFRSARGADRAVPGPAARRPGVIDEFLPKLEELVDRSKGKIRADVAH
jgi:transposase